MIGALQPSLYHKRKNHYIIEVSASLKIALTGLTIALVEIWFSNSMVVEAHTKIGWDTHAIKR